MLALIMHARSILIEHPLASADQHSFSTVFEMTTIQPKSQMIAVI